MQTAVRSRIRVDRGAFLNGSTDLLPLLERLVSVQFVIDEVSGKVAASIGLDGAHDRDTQVSRLAVSSLAVQAAAGSRECTLVSCAVTFARDAEVPFPFRGRVIETLVPARTPSLVARTDERVLAVCEHGPLWTVSGSQPSKHFRTALPFPQLTQGQSFAEVFNGERFLEMLPLVHFLREVTRKTVYQAPPLRATFIIDDPNLHWPSYGFVDYRELAAHARTHHYHVCFATIPLDTWFTHGATADLFCNNSRWLSLAIHGNNHGREELAQRYTDGERRGLLEQAIRRIERLEGKAKLRVCRVMVPPHGACSSDMLRDLPWSGFDAACISDGSLRAHNRQLPWTRTLGYFPSEVIEGCPVLPRWGLTGNVENTLLVAAYLGRPMILRGHHQDFKGGPGVFDHLAGFINGLGQVAWSNLTELSRRNYLWRMEGTCFRLKLLGSAVSFEVPAEATTVVVEEPNTTEADELWHATTDDGSTRELAPGDSLPAPAGEQRNVTIRRTFASRRPGGAVGPGVGTVKGVVRRLLTEARDRLLIA